MKALWLAAAMIMSASAQSETLKITVDGLLAGQGDLRVAIFNGPEQFPEGEFYKGVVVDADASTVTFEVADLPPGQYAISVFQDLDGTKKLKKNFLGIPKEPYGFSGSWEWGGASYKEASLDLPSGGAKINIKMK